jgi:hypothetical protein
MLFVLSHIAKLFREAFLGAGIEFAASCSSAVLVAGSAPFFNSEFRFIVLSVAGPLQT